MKYCAISGKICEYTGCTNWHCVKSVTGPVEYGWICSRCGKSNAPFVRSCDCYDHGTSTITYTYE